jgi:hypothetical protein
MGSLPRVHASEQMAREEPRLHIEAPQLANFETRLWPPSLICADGRLSIEGYRCRTKRIYLYFLRASVEAMHISTISSCLAQQFMAHLSSRTLHTLLEQP